MDNQLPRLGYRGRSLDEIMAFLICYSENPPTDDWKNNAAYLDQGFYATIFKHCRRNGARYPVLAQIASLDYDGELVVTLDQCAGLITELADLQSTLWFRRRAIAQFVAACESAVARKCALKIAGDMYHVYR